MNKLVIAFLCVASLVATSAHAGAGHDHGPKYGGMAREVGSVTYELVAKSDSLTLYVSDNGKPFATQGAKAEATIYAGNDKTTVALDPDGDNRMSAKGDFKVGVGVRVALRVTMTGKPEAKATFSLK